MYIADTLSRAFLSDAHPEHNMEMRVHSVSKYFPATPQKLQALREASLNDDVQDQIKRYLMLGWPKYKDNTAAQLHVYWGMRDEIHCEDDIIFIGESLIVPNAMRGEMLSRLHEGHLGTEKCRARARDIMYWPNMSTDIEETVSPCATCATYRKRNNKQPMIPHEIPDRPWANVGADMFSFKNQEYLVVVDYYSKFPEVEQLTCKTANGVITALRQIFSRHGIQEILFCDIMPFASHVMASFAEEMGFHISSPRYAQSNGQSETFVGIVKSFMRKAHEEGRDIWMSLLHYRNTPITGAPYSPAQLLMSRKLRDKMPSTSNILKPSVVPDGQSTMKHRQTRQKRFYDRGTTTRAPHRVGDNVRVPLHDRWDRAVVTGVCDTPRSYTVTTENGGTYRRNEKVTNPSREVTHIMPPESLECEEREDNLQSVEPPRAVENPLNNPAVVRSPLRAAVVRSPLRAAVVRSPLRDEPGNPTTRSEPVSRIPYSQSTPRRGSRLKSKPIWQ